MEINFGKQFNFITYLIMHYQYMEAKLQNSSCEITNNTQKIGSEFISKRI